MTNLEKQIAGYLKNLNRFIWDYKMVNDAKFIKKYNNIKEEAINQRIKNIHNKINYYLEEAI